MFLGPFSKTQSFDDLPPEAESAERGFLRLRPDIRMTPIKKGFELHWRAKHSLTLEHFELTDDEWFILCQLDGRTSPEEICRRYDQRFLPRRLSVDSLNVFLAEAHDVGLVDATSPGQARIRAARRRARLRRGIAMAPLSLLGIRWPLVDPTPLLNLLRPVGRFFFSHVFALALTAAWITLTILVIGRLGSLGERLPGLDDLLSTTGVGQMLVIWLIVKFLHELGHAVACDRFGAECHEAGVMFIGVLPVMYCDVTDAWSLASRWQRAAVSAGGIFVELFIAAACGYLWLAVGDGFIGDLLIRTMLVCSISTLVFNLNPLLRLDGYYLLSDVLEISNLHQRSRRAAWGGILRWLTRGRFANSRGEPRALWLAAFAVASMCYRAFVVAAIAWLAWRFFDERGAPAVGATMGVLMVVGIFASAAIPLQRTFRQARIRKSLSRIRAALLASVGSAALATALALPLPSTAPAIAMIAPSESIRLFSRHGGRLVRNAAYGKRVEAGEIVARILQPDLELRRVQLSGKLRELQAEREILASRMATDSDAASQLESLSAAETTVRNQLDAVLQDIAALSIRSPSAGVLLPPPIRRSSKERSAELPGWSGLPLDNENYGCWIESGDLLGVVAADVKRKAILVIDQVDVQDVAQGARVRLRLAQLPGKTLSASINSVGEDRVERLPATLAHALNAEMDRLESGEFRPRRPLYFAEAELTDAPDRLCVRSVGVAKVETDHYALWQRGWRALRKLWFAG